MKDSEVVELEDSRVDEVCELFSELSAPMASEIA
jgi:hypothetical protein